MTNMSESTSYDPIGRSRTEISVEVTMATLVCFSAMFGNLLVVFVIKRDSKLHNVTNMFIHSLALTDIAMATMYMPFWIASLYTGNLEFQPSMLSGGRINFAHSGLCFHVNGGINSPKSIHSSRKTQFVQKVISQ